MEIKVYNAYRNMAGDFFFGVIGIVRYTGEIGEICAEDVWHLANWSCWTNHKSKAVTNDGTAKYIPNNNDRGYTNDDVMFKMPEDGKWWVANVAGWSQFDEFRDAVNYMFAHSTHLG